ncbi:MAG: zinc metalloprotease HtpX [Bacteroidetes Order II. Incertae sedis bacterium]|jgi:heat shock protein HtpX|nr:zinc metalloprotease HtpX [Bacteroidetes Order II. bacterium]HAY37370.1 zinc metalloprotease HtpX [Bacteroidota bacterium]MBT5249601.1 zinc metalloprotease HtpX [Bacteroidetes Order II. bacterium]MBT6199837.1 zinc metalloprotease HtpX [Bacteroidetes Order II. bacterium]MBT6424435.1 zinc metalloprotease HtpX [Bacteroidetes Order II. bacterium]
MNGMRTAALMAALMVLFGLLGQALGGNGGMALALGFALLLNFGSYWFSASLVLKMYKAQEVTSQDAPELVHMIDDLRVKAGLPMPRIYVIPSNQPNAFATGRNPENAAVAVTNGIVRMLTRDELEGVIAHELAHIKNRDILTGSIAATVAAAITMLARFGMFFGGDRDRGGALSSLLMLILAPLAAMMIQMAISRSREFAADRNGAEICGKPEALASALLKLQSGSENVAMDANPATAHMFIVNPFAGAASGFRSLFSTHPPTEMRVEKLREMRF